MNLLSLGVDELRRLAARPANAHIAPALERRIAELTSAGAGAVAAAPRPKARRKPPARPRDGLGSIRLTLFGAPRTKKNSAARLSSGGRPSIVPSEAWMHWRDSVRHQVQPWMRLRDQPYNCAATFFRDADRGDATGFYQGLADVLQEMGIVSDDRLIRRWDGSELTVDREYPRVEITLTPIEEAR